MATNVNKQESIHDNSGNRALIGHSGTAGTSVTKRLVVTDDGALTVDIISGEIVASLGTVNVVESGTINTQDNPYAVQVDDGDVGTTIVGEAVVGGGTDSSIWRMKRIVDSGSAGTETVITWADGNSNFDNVWGNRASESWS